MAITKGRIALIPLAALLVLLVSRNYQPAFQPISGVSSSASLDRPSSSHRHTVQPTKLISSNSGFNAFHNLYARNGTLYLVSPPNAPPFDDVNGGGGGFEDRNGKGILPFVHIISTGLPMSAPPALRDPTPNEIQVVPWEDRGKVLGLDDGRKIFPIEGSTWILSDSGQFMTHFYHFWAELIIGSWKALSLGFSDSENKFDTIEDPRRIMFVNANEDEWRDKPRVSPFILKAVFPSTSYEYKMDWKERALTDMTFVFDTVVIADRHSGHQGVLCKGSAPKWQPYYKIMADVLLTEVNSNWWKPIRQRLIDGLPEFKADKAPVVTYISRQLGGRKLRNSDHERLVAALEEAAKRHGWILEIPSMEYMPKDAQLALAARTTVLLGVHGNGLSHQLWMNPSPFSTVIEMFVNEGYFYDYALPAHSLGHAHFGAWSDGEGNNTIIDSALHFQPDGFRKVHAPPGYHGDDIRADGPTVARLIEQRLKGWKA